MLITLTELSYVLSLAREKHFGRAAKKCFVSQPTLSIAIKNLEDKLGLQIFERNKSQVIVTLHGLEIIAYAQNVIESVTKIEDYAKQKDNPLSAPLKIGAIHTVGPYLFPGLIAKIIELNSMLKLEIQEDITANLHDKLISGELDAIIVAKPFIRSNIKSIDLYSENMMVIIPSNHPWKTKQKLNPEELNDQTVLLLENGHCFREQVLQICPQCSYTQANGTNHTLITSSIETIKYMVANSIGISIVPSRSLLGINSRQILHKPFTAPSPKREIILAYRNGFGRLAALEELTQIIKQL